MNLSRLYAQGLEQGLGVGIDAARLADLLDGLVVHPWLEALLSEARVGLGGVEGVALSDSPCQRHTNVVALP